MTPDEIKTLVLEFAEKQGIWCSPTCDGCRRCTIQVIESLPTYQSLIAKEATESAYLAAYGDLEKAVRSGCGVEAALAAIDALSERRKP